MTSIHILLFGYFSFVYEQTIYNFHFDLSTCFLSIEYLFARRNEFYYIANQSYFLFKVDLNFILKTSRQ